MAAIMGKTKMADRVAGALFLSVGRLITKCVFMTAVAIRRLFTSPFNDIHWLRFLLCCVCTYHETLGSSFSLCFVSMWLRNIHMVIGGLCI